ncbi:hypothetical protein EVAR_96683_1 [Eumeta japonica]|uniref:Uncharacterized protein n=1 Tax=Eumeta variegata TaxID=151549 RepID=A0A4C1WJV7_EUMVA|nr:hypothetical protein EVAR_96683_1 [Eumeta japonica]
METEMLNATSGGTALSMPQTNNCEIVPSRRSARPQKIDEFSEVEISGTDNSRRTMGCQLPLHKVRHAFFRQTRSGVNLKEVKR